MTHTPWLLSLVAVATLLPPVSSAAGAETRRPVPAGRVRNGDFEADHYTHWPGGAARNGGITAWKFTGNAGINPVWGDRAHRWAARTPFADNGKPPAGEQVAYIQNIGELRQRIKGLEPGATYRVVYFENGRVTRIVTADQVLEVLVGDRVVVSPHPVPPVDAKGRHRTPYFKVESAAFTAPDSGAIDLVFRTREKGGTSVLIDGVRVERVPAPAVQ